MNSLVGLACFFAMLVLGLAILSRFPRHTCPLCGLTCGCDRETCECDKCGHQWTIERLEERK